MPLVFMRRPDGVRGDQAGGAQTGTGIRGSARTHLFRGMESSIARSVGGFIPLGWCMTRRCSIAMAALVTDTRRTTTISARTIATGDRARTMLEARIMPAEFIADRARLALDFAPDRERWAAALRVQVPVDSTAAAVVAFTAEVSPGVEAAVSMAVKFV